MTSSLTPIASAARKAPKPKKRKSNGLRNARPPTASRLYQDTYISFRVPGTPVMAGCGPILPSPSCVRHGSYRGISCRQLRCGITAEDDPTLPSAASAGHGSYQGISCRQRRRSTTGEFGPTLPSLTSDRHGSSWRIMCRQRRRAPHTRSAHGCNPGAQSSNGKMTYEQLAPPSAGFC